MGEDLGKSKSQSPAEWKAWHSWAILIGVIAIVVIGYLPTIPWVTAYYLTAGVLAAVAVVIGLGLAGNWKGILFDESNRISLSRFQLVLWTLVIVPAILTAAFGNLYRSPPDPDKLCLNKGALDITISANVWALLGITLTSTVAAALVNELNRQKGVSHVRAAGQSPNWGDLFRATEGTNPPVDITRVQIFFFTVVLVMAYGALITGMFVTGHKICTFPELTSGMLTLLGISHAGYIARKAVPQ